MGIRQETGNGSIVKEQNLELTDLPKGLWVRRWFAASSCSQLSIQQMVLEIYKARPVAKGYTHTYGLDY